MRSIIVPAMAALAAAKQCAGGMAFSQEAPQTPPAAGVASTDLSEEDRNAAPLPPGRHAGVVKKVCIDCHGGKVITDLRYSKEDAERFYKNMVSSDVTTEQARQIIEYLSTTLGQ
jgi:hypothetical protein